MAVKNLYNFNPKGPSSIGTWSTLQLGLKTEFLESINTWKKTLSSRHPSAQFLSIKTLRNGNTQERIVTALEDGYLCTETNVYSPSGDLLKAYAGIRQGHTNMYKSGKDAESVKEVVNKITAQGKGVKTLANLE